jgi:hypothetical protein
MRYLLRTKVVRADCRTHGTEAFDLLEVRGVVGDEQCTGPASGAGYQHVADDALLLRLRDARRQAARLRLEAAQQ